MGKYEDYINGLEGKTDLNIENVVSDLLNIHNEEVGINTAKIAELNATIEEKNGIIATRDGEIQSVKAKNWDLANQIPGEKEPETDSGTGLPDGSNITIDDLLG